MALGRMPAYSVGHYSSDPADLAAVNAGLRPSERAAIVYIMSPWERWRADYERERWEDDQCARAAANARRRY